MIATGEHFGIPPQFAEKDYYVTESLRIIASDYAETTVFKGGTSLSKGWRLITRFSEDIDLFVNPDLFDPPLGKKGVNKQLKRLRDAVAAHPGLTLLETESKPIGGRARSDVFGFNTQFGELGGIRPAVMIESGIRSGTFPTEKVTLRSYAAEYLAEAGLDSIADDLGPFEMNLLHYRRTYVEKILTLHSNVVVMLDGGMPLERNARHYADVHILGQTEEVQRMLHSDEYAIVKADCDAVSRTYFKNYRPPEGSGLSESPALFPDEELAVALEQEYRNQCDLLFYGPYPPFRDVLAGFQAIRDLL
jgi:hypothetical protein